MLLFILNKFGQFRVGHDIDILISIAYSHVFTSDLRATLPLFVANIEGSHLIIGIATRIENGLIEIEERGIAIYF